MGGILSKMLSPCAFRYLYKTSAEARRSLAAAAASWQSNEEVCETCVKTLKPGEGKSQLSGSFSCIVCPDCYEEECGRCEDCSVKLSGDDKGNDKCQDCLEQGCAEEMLF